MINYKDLFGDEVCKCGKKGDFIISNGSGKVQGFECKKCKKKSEKARKTRKILNN